MDALLLDLRYAARALLARPGFTIVVALTLGLGIGANTAVFSAVHALLLRPFPFADPDRLVRISTIKGGQEGGLAVPEQDDLAGLANVIEDIALYTDQGLYNASGFGQPEELQATIATHNLFRVLGVAPLVGSTYPAGSDRSRRFELVISHGLWMRRFGGDPRVVGRTLTLDGAPGYTIHGVMPPEFNFPAHSDLFRSAGIAGDPKSYERRDWRGRMGVARLKPGVTLAQARERIEALGSRLAREFPETNTGLQFHVLPIRDLYVGNVRSHLVLLFGAVGLVLLIACANVASLLLSRALARDREIAVRLALGAGRGRIVRQLLTESLLLALLGAGVGLALAYVGIDLLVSLVRVPLPAWMHIGIDAATLGFLTLIAVLTGLAAGLLPTLGLGTSGRAGTGGRSRGRDHGRQLTDALKDGARGVSGGARHHRIRNALVVSEVALAVVLLVGASLMLQSFLRIQQVHPGFDAQSLLTFRVELGWRAYDTHDKVIAFNDRVLQRLSQLPGVRAVGLDSNLPLSGRPRDPADIVADGQSVEAQHANPFVHYHVVSDGYFQSLGIPILSGRGFLDSDHARGQPIVIVSRRLAERLWPGADALGQRIKANDTGQEVPWLTVVGVAGDVKLQHLAMPAGLDVYVPFRQVHRGGSWFIVRTQGVDPISLSQAAPRIVPEMDPNQSFFDVQVMTERIAASIWQQRASGALFAAFAALALVLAAVGLYGVLSYMVTQQWREIGVRVALGAGTRDVLTLVMGRGLLLTATGLLIGLLAAWMLTHTMTAVLYDVRATDPWTFAAAPLALLLVALLACALPARRACRVDPVTALRAD